MDDKKQHAESLLNKFKGGNYVYGLGCFDRLGGLVASLGKRASVVISGTGKDWGPALHDATRRTLEGAGVELAGAMIPGAQPNAPRADVFRIAAALEEQAPEVVVGIGGGSCLDAAKAAAAYWVLHDQYPDLDDYFGLGRVSKMLESSGRRMPPLVAAQTASGSAAHLTKYSNITDPGQAQKLLIIDEALVPPKCLFDYAMTVSMSRDFTMDGALDGAAHCLEVLYGAPADANREIGVPGKNLETIREVTLLGLSLIVNHVKTACDNPGDIEAREALGLGTDLGGYAIMIGGTNGAHLTSFSLVDVLSHGRACALMNPYYTVFFAPAIEPKLRAVGAVYKDAGYTRADLDHLHGRDLGLEVAEAMLALSNDIGFPTTLAETPGFTAAHIERALSAAQNPALEMKLKNMPVPLSAQNVEQYMRPILEAARTGDFTLIRNMP